LGDFGGPAIQGDMQYTTGFAPARETQMLLTDNPGASTAGRPSSNMDQLALRLAIGNAPAAAAAVAPMAPSLPGNLPGALPALGAPRFGFGGLF
jgi:hypothetical protein